MDPLLRLYLFEHWIRDQEQEYESLRGQSILIGSFTNPEMARQMVKAESPDFSSTDEDFAKSAQMVLSDREKTTAPPTPTRRRRIPPNQQPQS